jgi:hypothetical protein
MIEPMTTATRTAWRPRWALAFLAAVLAVAVGLFGAAPASAATTPAAQNAVGASTSAGQVAVGPSVGIGAGQRLGNDAPRLGIVVATGVAAETGAPLIKAGSAGGETAGRVFPQSIRQEALAENPGTCVYCRMETQTPQVDHVIPRSTGGNATLENAQTTCPWCNASKGPREFPVNPAPGYEGAWPPGWWGSSG